MITVIDAIMGSGKTTYMTELMNELHIEALGQSFMDHGHEGPRFLYVTPSLTEVDRIKKACPNLDFRDPQVVGGRKLNHLTELVSEGANVCTTHALFKMLNRKVYESLKAQNYTLVIDEALDCVSVFDDLTLSDRQMLAQTDWLHVEPDTNRLVWNHARGDYEGEFESIRDLCDNRNLILYRDAVLWEFPTEFFRCFKKAYVLTYLFGGSPMSAHIRADGLSYELMTLTSDRRLVLHAETTTEAEAKARLNKLINVYEGSANAWGERKGKAHPFSLSWYKRKPSELNGIKAALQNWFKKVAGTPAKHNAWTAYSVGRSKLAGSPYAKGWIPCNAKGTNDHIERRSLAYLCNVFYNPVISGYFADRGIVVDEDTYALSEMIQWVWRSQIRRYDPIHVFIPSHRMRSLFKRWLTSSVSSELSVSQSQHQLAA